MKHKAGLAAPIDAIKPQPLLISFRQLKARQSIASVLDPPEELHSPAEFQAPTREGIEARLPQPQPAWPQPKSTPLEKPVAPTSSPFSQIYDPSKLNANRSISLAVVGVLYSPPYRTCRHPTPETNIAKTESPTEYALKFKRRGLGQCSARRYKSDEPRQDPQAPPEALHQSHFALLATRT